MSFVLSEEQHLLRDTVASYLADHYSFQARQAATRSEMGWRPEVWRGFAEDLGILGACFPEELGGLGGGGVETMVIMEEFGKSLVVEPYLATVVIGGGFLKYGAIVGAATWIEGIIAGKITFAFAYAEPQGRYDLANLTMMARREADGWVLNGRKVVVIGAPWASHLIVTARTGGQQCDASGISVFIIDRSAAGISANDYSTIDGMRAADLIFEDVHLSPDALIGIEGKGLALIERVVDEAIAATCAEACGVMHTLYQDTVEYTKQRRQFGVPIASFQVLQHRMVDMFIAFEKSQAMTRMATQMLEAPPQQRALAMSAAKVQIGQACRFVGQNAVQLHGGIGITEELALSHYFRRATVIESSFGSVDHHLSRFEALTAAETT